MLLVYRSVCLVGFVRLAFWFEMVDRGGKRGGRNKYRNQTKIRNGFWGRRKVGVVDCGGFGRSHCCWVLEFGLLGNLKRMVLEVNVWFRFDM